VEIARLHTRLSATSVYVTHDQGEAMTLGHRVAVMEAGKVQQVEKPLRLYDCPGNVFVAGFIGIPAMNFFSGTVVDRGEELFFVEELQGPVTSSYGMSLRIEQTFHKGLLDYL